MLLDGVDGECWKGMMQWGIICRVGGAALVGGWFWRKVLSLLGLGGWGRGFGRVGGGLASGLRFVLGGTLGWAVCMAEPTALVLGEVWRIEPMARRLVVRRLWKKDLRYELANGGRTI